MSVLTFSNGDTMPILGLGTWLSHPNEVYNAVRKAIEIGYRHFDCALFYGNESEIGIALNDAMRQGEVRRDDLWITSKLWNNAHAPADVRPSIETTLADLNLDYLDLYLIHWPVLFKKEVRVPQSVDDLLPPGVIPLSDTWTAMTELRSSGLTRHIGVSNFNANHIEEVTRATGVAPEVNQFEIHPYLAQTALVEYCHSHQIHITAYGSLAMSVSDERLAGAGLPRLIEHPVIRDIAMRRSMTPAQVVLKWLIDRQIAVIPKSVNPSRLEQNFATNHFNLTAIDKQAVQQLDAGFRCVTGIHWNRPGSPYSEQYVWGP